MARISEETIEKARQMDLLTYLKLHEPQELVRKSSGEYTTRTHGSLTISNGKWMWWAQNFGGYTALDYLVKVKGIPFREAVYQLAGQEQAVEIPPVPVCKKAFELPAKAETNETVIRYLMKRGIDEAIIKDCIESGFIYESSPYHNVVFVGKDERGIPRNASFRACNEKRIMGEASGSEKQYAFRLLAEDMQNIQVFESAIDLLSYATCLKRCGYDYREFTLVSLGGIYIPKNEGKMTMPRVLEHLIQNYPDIKKIVLHLDNDEAGRKATLGIMELLKDDYCVSDSPPPRGKDFNDYLLEVLEREREKENERQ